MKEKNGANFKIFTIILLILLLCSVGYIVYDKVLMNNNNKEISNETDSNAIDTTTDNAENAAEINGFSINNKSEIQSFDFSFSNVYFYVLVSKDGHAYLALKDNGVTDEQVKKSLSNLQSKYSSNEIDGYCEGNTPNEVYPNGSKVDSFKLDLDGVMMAYHARSGQDYYGEWLIFLMQDGTISRINLGKLLYNNSIEIENNVDNLHDIVSIGQSNSTCSGSGYGKVLAIESNGKQHVLSNINGN